MENTTVNRNHPDRDVEPVDVREKPTSRPPKIKKPRKVMTLDEAIAIATEAHDGQLDKAGKPYILHPLAVVEILRAAGADDEQMIAGALHDVVEDTDVTIKELRKKGASGRVIKILQLVTHKDGVSNKEYWDEISRVYDAVMVKGADMSHNSSPERMASITDPDDNARLMKKYEEGRKVIFQYYTDAEKFFFDV